MLWNVHYRSREFAKEMGDPILCTVEATTKEDAERIADENGYGYPGAGLWAVPAHPRKS